MRSFVPLKLLVIGGGVFVGRHFVEAAVAAGHEVTVFHRGHTSLPPDWKVTEVIGDRDGLLEPLASGSWDAVYDSVGYVPRLVKDSAEFLKDRVGRYLFISTISVYSDANYTVTTPNPPVGTEVVDRTTYGPLKVECENALREVMGDRGTIVRPGLIAGPYDPTRRFDYWVDRFSRYAQVVVPDVLGDPLQLIDARDLALFSLKLIENDVAGVFDVVGEPITFGDMIHAASTIGGGKAVLVSPKVLKENGIELGHHMPLASYRDATSRALMTIEPKAAIAQGLTRRPLVETARDTAVWTRSLAEPRFDDRSGLSREAEEALLAKL